jgi:N-terminal acetyltransferase B complex non-catalytic subunit
MLQDAKVKLKELTQNAEDLTRISASNFDLNKLQNELIILREENVSYIQELKKKNEYLEQLKQENEKLKEKDLSVCFMNMEKELIALRKINLLFIEQLKIKDESLEMHIKQIEELMAEREQCLKCIEKCHKEMKQQNEKFINVSICTSDVSKVQEEENSMKELNLMCNTEVMTEVNFLETLKQNTENVYAEQEPNVKYIEQLQEREQQCEEVKESGSRSQEHGCLYDGLKALTKINSVCIKKMKEKDECLETLRHQIEETYLKYSDQLQEKDTQLKEQIEDLNKRAFNTQELCREEELNSATENNLLNTELKAKDGYLELTKTLTQHNTELIFAEEELKMLKEQGIWYDRGLSEEDNHHEILKKPTEHWSPVEMANSKYIDKMKEENVTMQEEVAVLKEENSIKVKLRKDKDRYLETLKKQNQTLDSLKEASSKYIDELKANNVTVQKANVSLEEKNSLYREQLRQKDYYLEKMKQQIEDLNCEREAHLTSADELKADNVSLQAEIISLKENNSMYMRQVKEKDDCLETLKQKIEDLNTGKDANLKYIDELEANIVSLQKQVQSLKEKYSMYSEQVMEKNNFLEKMQQEIENLNSGKEANLKDINELKVNNENLKKVIISLQEKNSMYMVELKEADSCLEALRQDIEHLNFGREANLNDINELKVNNDSLKKEIISLQEKNSMYMEKLNEKDNYLDTLKRDFEQLNSSRETDLKYIEELVANVASMQTEIHCLVEKNSMYEEQLKEKDHYLEILKQQTEYLNYAKGRSLKNINDLRVNNERLQKEIVSPEERNSVYVEQLKEKDDYLETLKQGTEDLNCARERNLKVIDELKVNNDSLQKEIISLEEKNSLYMEQLKEKDGYLETEKQVFEDVTETETKLEHSDELKINIRMGKESNSIKEDNAMCSEQLNERDSYSETLKQQTEDMKSVKHDKLKYTEQLHEKNKCLDFLKHEIDPHSQEYGALAKIVECCITHVPTELSMITRSLSAKSHEIESCRTMILKEVSDLKPDYDVESVSEGQLTDLLKLLLTFVMEKEMETFHSLEDKMNEICIQANEAEKECANKNRQKDCWVRELEAEIEHLHAYVARVEEEKKVLEMDDKSHYLAILEQERNDLRKKLRQLESDLVVVQLERNHMESRNKEMTRMLENLQLLLEEKSSQLQEEQENHFNKSQKLETLMKEIFDLGGKNVVLLENLQKRNNDNNLLLKKVEDLQCAVMSKENENLDIVRKLSSLELELKVLSMKNSALEEEVFASKEIHSLLLKEKEHCSEITLNLKKVTEDVENLTVEKLAWDSEKEQLQAKVAEKQNELSLERDIRCRLERDMVTNIQKVKEEKDQLQNELSLERGIRCRFEKDMMINTQKVKEEKDQLQVSYSHLLQNYEMLKDEINNSHLIKQAHSLNVPDFMSQKPEITVAVPDENLELNKWMEEKLQKQRELARRNENLATCITDLKEEVNRLGNENANLRESVKTFSEEKNRLNALMYIKESEIEGFKRQLKVFFHEKSALVVACKSVQKPMQQQEDAVDCGNKEYSSLISEKESCTENLGSRSQFSMRMADRTVQECRAEVSEERKLKEQLQVCMEEKVALSNENERLATDIHGLQKTLERYCVEKNSLEKSLEALEEERKKLVSQLSVSHKRFFEAENEVREMKLKMKKDETSQEKSVPRLRMAEAEVEHIQIRKKSLLQQCQNVGHNISKRARYCQVQSQQVETGNVPKSSVATNTDISGTVCCMLFAKCILANCLNSKTTEENLTVKT